MKNEKFVNVRELEKMLSEVTNDDLKCKNNFETILSRIKQYKVERMYITYICDTVEYYVISNIKPGDQ